MTFLDSRKYFPDPVVASFVDKVQRGSLADVKKALRDGVNANALGTNGYRPIHFVYNAPDASVLKELLAAGADPMARLENGNTPLHFAVRMPNPEFTQVLLAAGADPNAKGEHGKPVLTESLSSHAPKILEILVKAGARIDAEWGGSTPVMTAIVTYSWEMATTLIDLNANLHFKNSAGKTAIDKMCQRAEQIPASDMNKKGIMSLYQAIRKRNIAVPCEHLLAKFR